MTFLVATNVIASRPPERRPTGTPHARANSWIQVLDSQNIYKQILFYCYLTFPPSKITPPQTNYLFFLAQNLKGGPMGEKIFC